MFSNDNLDKKRKTLLFTAVHTILVILCPQTNKLAQMLTVPLATHVHARDNK